MGVMAGLTLTRSGFPSMLSSSCFAASISARDSHDGAVSLNMMLEEAAAGALSFPVICHKHVASPPELRDEVTTTPEKNYSECARSELNFVADHARFDVFIENKERPTTFESAFSNHMLPTQDLDRLLFSL